MNDAGITEAINTARAHLGSGRYAQAEFIYRQLVQHFPTVPELNEELMESLFLQERFDDSYEAFRAFVALQPDNADSQFETSYLAAMRTVTSQPWPLQRRARFRSLVQLLMQTRAAIGDIAECGCYLGLSSHLMCSYLRLENAGFRGAGFHVFDSFQGLSAPTMEDDVPADLECADQIEAMCMQGNFAANLPQVRRNLAEFPDIEFHPGWIPLTFRDLPDRKYRFVHVDVDLYDPTLESFEYFYPHLAPGGIMVSDDYDWPGARRAIEEFCRERALEFCVTPQNQAYVQRR